METAEKWLQVCSVAPFTASAAHRLCKRQVKCLISSHVTMMYTIIIRHTVHAEATCSSFPYMEISPEVADAVAARRPVVALETTLVTHGMPYPDNIK